MEVSRFITAYNKCRNEEDRLESTSKIMGWGQGRLVLYTDDLELDEEQIKEIRLIPMDEIHKMEPYTVYKHPVYVSTTALFSSLVHPGNT